MNRNVLSIVLSSGVAVLLVATVSTSQAGPNPLPPRSDAFGASYAEHAVGWMQWALAIPNDMSPVSDVTGEHAATGQSGRIWYLAGTFGGSVTRTITMPTRKAVYFPIVNYFWVNLPELGDAPWSEQQEAYARSVLASSIDGAQNLALEVDGAPISIASQFRIKSTVGLCTLPTAAEDNIFGADLEAGPHECVADGYWVLLPPLARGKHTIHFAGELPTNDFSLDVTYDIMVTPMH